MSAAEDDHVEAGDHARLVALRSYEVLDRPHPPVLDELTRAAAAMFDTPMSAVSLVDADRQWFAGSTGLADAQTPLDVSFCAHTVATGQPLIVPDATADSRFADYRCVTDAPYVRFYAGAPIVDDDGYALGAMCVIDERPRTISDRQHDALILLAGQAAGHLGAIRNRLRMAELGDELARAAQREEDLVATISHELRTPVASIQGYLEMLAEHDDLAPYHRLIEAITRNGHRLVTMVDHLLAGTRPAGAALALHTATIDLATVADAAVAACRPLAARQDVKLIMRTDGTATAQADLTRLAHAVEQLVRNAVQFTRVGGAVTVTVTADPRPAITVTDTGIGIPADELPHVFVRFYRGHHARSQAVAGVGLGLTIARTIITAHQGTVQLTSTSDGTTAHVTL
ncbi:MAG TPA: GAF domain-containing sensor histidine kinase [Actinoplanes sp.]|jgi:signal transduction histidine kinase